MAGKGSAFEREICKKLSLWFSGGTAEDWYWRTAGSGARATTRAKSGKTTRGHYGDICATCPEAEPLLKKITFELKRGYNHATLQDLFDRPETAAKQTWQKWIEQARKSAAAAGTPYWAIISRRDRCREIITMPRSLDRRLPCHGHQIRLAGVVSTPFDDFLKLISPKEIREL